MGKGAHDRWSFGQQIEHSIILFLRFSICAYLGKIFKWDLFFAYLNIKLNRIFIIKVFHAK